jgi:hypothetical protein
MLRKRILVIAIVLTAVVIGAVGLFLIMRNSQSPQTFALYDMEKQNRLPCVLFYDAPSNETSFAGALFMNLVGAEIQVDDPQGSDTGRYSADQCFLHGTNSSRTVTLTVTLPQGYTTTHPSQFKYDVPPSTAFIEMGPAGVSQVGIQKSS